MSHLDLIGKKFWTYRIEGVLGSGGTATVYRAFDEKEQRSVAIKILPEGMDRSQIQRFKQETKVLSQLDHPNIIKIFDIGSADGLLFYVMENRPSRTLRELMDERFARAGKGFTVDELLTMAHDVGDALRCSHSKRIFHRDVKPSNILVTPEFRAILCDFGLAKVTDDKTLTVAGTLMGTPLYMSPEQLQGGDVDQRSDLYQLGLVLYQMATGQIPFAGENPYVSATRRLSEAIPPPTALRHDLPGGLEQVMMRCVERERPRRYQSANDLLTDLDRLSSSKLRAGEHTVIRERGTPRANAMKIGAAAVALAGAVAGAFFAVAPRGADVLIQGLAVIPGRTDAIVAFTSAPDLRAELLYGEGDELDRRRVISAEPEPAHRVTITGLAPGKPYRCQIRLFVPPDRLKELPARSFRTLEE